MKLDREICLGGRFNRKEVLGIRFNGYNIYPYLPSGARLYVPGEFYNNKTITEVNVIVTTNHDNLNMMFYGCDKLETIRNMDKWDTSSVTIMQEMFHSCNNLITVGDLSNWNTSNVTSMGRMFFKCKNLTELDLSNWNTSGVEIMDMMFYGCENLTKLNLSNFDISNVEYTMWMFDGCDKLQELRLDNCSYDTISKLIDPSESDLPTNTISGTTRKIYVKQENAADLTPPSGWVFEYID